MINCEQAGLICDKSQYDEASLWERFQLWIHLLYCKSCAGHSKKNKQLTNLCSKAPLKSLSPKEKDTLKAELTEKHKEITKKK